MTTRMSMRDRREKIEELVQNDPRVQACTNEFTEARVDITDWHVRNDALCATKAELKELADMIAYSEFCLEDLKCAKTAAYNQLMSQYPHVWDTTCDDPFNTDTQDDATDTGAETEEMEEVPRADPLIRADKLMGILDREQAAYKVSIGFCDLWDLDASDLHARLATVQTIRTQLERLIDEAKETPNA
ncbi:hypothetical protein CQR51_0984 [Bifidobacterium pseudolongum subsp. globosum]|uniref:hypothetical protein n=1 Tax=Bifidobacterium pseudolongum TaxID=1694 RepID=UPI000CBC3FC4|nr:hypothetical protein [Bifidobacterium pseudolongum]PKV05740.1 hypothetical protein CQR51_0984 [Bifidobacterium pseudolongum subsp. globosum]RYQ56591.1 hypothetical protein PG1565B_1052 [Bifidobacterium pseudolongum subsp. globosum]RYQ60512.1 hypothetical protein PG1546B_1052 [Bifidobacterium pseudolongum subsp. globosum]